MQILSSTLSASDFQAIFESVPDRYVILMPDFRIVAVSNAYLRSTMKKREEMLGQGYFDVFPEKTDDPENPASASIRNLKISLEQVLLTKTVDIMTVQRYEFRKSKAKGGGVEERFLRPMNSPILDADGNVAYIVHRVEDVTEYLQLKESEVALQMHTQDMLAEIGLRCTEVQEAYEHVEEVNIKLQEVSRVKSEFLANMSHELRTPLNAIIGFSEMLKDDQLGELTDQQRKFISNIFHSGKHLLSLINDILDLSKIEAGKMQLDIESVDVGLLLENCISIIRERAMRNRVTLNSDIGSDVGIILADQRKIRQIIYNLLSNAVKFTHQGGSITLSVRNVLRSTVGKLSGGLAVRSFPLPDNEFTEFIEIGVSDTGIGISSSGLEQLFQPFSQIDGGLARKFEGTGLGLVLLKQMAELHGGTVAVESKENCGSCFYVWLPRRSEPKSSRTLQHGAGI